MFWYCAKGHQDGLQRYAGRLQKYVRGGFVKVGRGEVQRYAEWLQRYGGFVKVCRVG